MERLYLPTGHEYANTVILFRRRDDGVFEMTVADNGSNRANAWKHASAESRGVLPSGKREPSHLWPVLTWMPEREILHTPDSRNRGRVGMRRKLVEVALPLEAINEASAREKSIRHGHPSTLHLWWARRPLGACRAVLFAQLVDDPSSWPEASLPRGSRSPSEAAARLHRRVGAVGEQQGRARAEPGALVHRSLARLGPGRGTAPTRTPQGSAALSLGPRTPVYDPFCGGGSIPLEAQRLGLRAYGSDLNPVAVLITKALVESRRSSRACRR